MLYLYLVVVNAAMLSGRSIVFFVMGIGRRHLMFSRVYYFVCGFCGAMDFTRSRYDNQCNECLFYSVSPIDF